MSSKLPTDYAELRRIVERARIELVYTRSSLRQFSAADPETAKRIETVMRKCGDVIGEADRLIEKIR